MKTELFRTFQPCVTKGRIALILLVATWHLNAEVTPTHFYRFGENDTGAVSDGVANQATDWIGASALQAIGTPLFSSDVADSAAGHTGSRFGVYLDGGFQAFARLDSLPTSNTNFGLELWVKPSQLPDGFSLVVYNGDTRFNGWGIYQNGNTFGVSYGGLERFGSATAEVDQWAHLALVSDSGVSTFYVNGLPAGESHTLPLDAQGGFAIGAHPQLPLDEHFAGWVDEVRLFTFDPGTFTPDDLLVRQRSMTLSASSINDYGAILNGSVLPEAGSVQAWFELRPETGAITATPAQHVAEGLNLVPLSAAVTDLLPSTLYHCRLVISNSAQVFRGSDIPFPTHSTVTSLDNDGPGSLRQVLRDSAPSDTIHWKTPGTIHLTGSSLELTQSVTLVSDDPLTHIVDGDGSVRLIIVRPGATVRLDGMTFKNGHAPDGAIIGGGLFGFGTASQGEGGGAILNQGELILNRCILKRNRGGDGGSFGERSVLSDGIGGGGGPGGAIYSQGSLSLESCRLEDNEAGSGGSGAKKVKTGGALGVFGYPGGDGGLGGALFNHGSAHIRNTSFVNNRAGGGGSGAPGENAFSGVFPGPGGRGGNGGAFFNDGTLELLQSTLSLNSAGNPGPSGGGFISQEDGGRGGAIATTGVSNLLTLTACTVVSNSPSLSSETGAIENQSTNAGVTLRSCLIGRNGLDGAAPDLNGPFATAGFNIISIAQAASRLRDGVRVDRVGSAEKPIDLHLEPLTQFSDLCAAHPLTLSSPALEAGDDSLLSPPLELTTDQAGHLRRTGNHVDAGAMEFAGGIPPALATTLEATLLGDPDPTTGTRRVTLNGVINPSGPASRIYFELGLSTVYGGLFVAPSNQSGFQNIPVTQTITGLAPGLTYHYRVAFSNAVGITHGADRTFTLPSSLLLGDRDGDGRISGAELQEVLNRYWSNPSWLRMSNVAGLGEPLVTFDLPDVMASPMSVESTTDFTSWQIVGLALPRFEFIDTNAPSSTPRFYRLRSN